MEHKESWLWPDHVIGKRESRRLREEHNRLVNQKADLLAAAEKILAAHDSGNNGAVIGEAVLCPYFANMLRAVVRDATGPCEVVSHERPA